MSPNGHCHVIYASQSYKSSYGTTYLVNLCGPPCFGHFLSAADHPSGNRCMTLPRAVTLLTLLHLAPAGGSPQEVLHIVERAAARKRHSSQVVKPALNALKILTKCCCRVPSCTACSIRASLASYLAALGPQSAQHRDILSSRMMLSSPNDGASPSLLAVRARRAIFGDRHHCCRLLQVGLLPPEVAKVEAVKLRNARCAHRKVPSHQVCSHLCRQMPSSTR